MCASRKAVNFKPPMKNNLLVNCENYRFTWPSTIRHHPLFINEVRHRLIYSWSALTAFHLIRFIQLSPHSRVLLILENVNKLYLVVIRVLCINRTFCREQFKLSPWESAQLCKNTAEHKWIKRERIIIRMHGNCSHIDLKFWLNDEENVSIRPAPQHHSTLCVIKNHKPCIYYRRKIYPQCTCSYIVHRTSYTVQTYSRPVIMY